MYKLEPELYHFHPSTEYPELSDHFGSDTYIKVIEMHDKGTNVACWYLAISSNDQFNRYEISSGLYLQGKPLHERDWPKREYFGLISNKEFAEELLAHIFGTTTNESVKNEGVARLTMKCLVLDQPKKSKKQKT